MLSSRWALVAVEGYNAVLQTGILLVRIHGEKHGSTRYTLHNVNGYCANELVDIEAMKVEYSPTATELLAQVQDFLNGRLHFIREHLTNEELPLPSLVGRVLAEDIISAVDLPRFRRAMMDGVAIDFQHLSAGCRRWPMVEDRQALDLLSIPVAFPVATGALVPDQLDTVLPREGLVSIPALDNLHSEFKFIETPEVAKVQRGQHVAQVGEDVRAGQILLSRGRVVRA